MFSTFLNTAKSQHTARSKRVIFSTPEQILVASYLEALLEDNADIITASWNQPTIPGVPTISAGMFPASTGQINAANPTLLDKLVFNYWGQKAGTVAGTYLASVLVDPLAIANATECIMSAQFTFLLAVAKKGMHRSGFMILLFDLSKTSSV